MAVFGRALSASMCIWVAVVCFVQDLILARQPNPEFFVYVEDVTDRGCEYYAAWRCFDHDKCCAVVFSW